MKTYSKMLTGLLATCCFIMSATAFAQEDHRPNPPAHPAPPVHVAPAPHEVPHNMPPHAGSAPAPRVVDNNWHYHQDHTWYGRGDHVAFIGGPVYYPAYDEVYVSNVPAPTIDPNVPLYIFDQFGNQLNYCPSYDSHSITPQLDPNGNLVSYDETCNL
jgi:hypothetical protein